MSTRSHRLRVTLMTECGFRSSTTSTLTTTKKSIENSFRQLFNNQKIAWKFRPWYNTNKDALFDFRSDAIDLRQVRKLISLLSIIKHLCSESERAIEENVRNLTQLFAVLHNLCVSWWKSDAR